MNNITVNIVEPGSGPTPAPVVPNTGLFTHGIGGPEATIITVSIVAIIAIVALVLYYKKKHSKDNTANKVDKAEKATKLAKTISTIKAKKKVSIPLAALALVVSLGTLTALLVNAGKSNTSAAEGDNSLTVTESSEDLTIEVADEPVFAVLPVEVTVEEATEAGYTLTAYTDNTDLVSTTDGSKIIPMVAADEGELVALAEDTYGLSLSQPTSQDDEVYTVLSTDADNPTVIKTIDDYSPTPAEDKTTIYYGFYITPDTPKGTYEGSVINYEAKENTATVVFDGNGLYFNNDEEQTTNTAKYTVSTTDNTEKYSHTPNITDEGVQEGNVGYQGRDVVDEVITIPGAASVHAELTYGGGLVYGSYEGGWASLWQGSHPNYTAQSDYGNDDSIKNCGGGDVTNGKYSGGDTNTTVECDITGDSVTFAYYAQGGGPGNGPTYGYYAIVTGYDADGNIIYLPENNLVSGNYLIPSSEAYSRFLGWSTTQEATAPEYVTEEDIKKELALTPGETTTLYAKWEPAFTISYNGNGADSTSNMDYVEQYTADLTSTNKQVDLLASNFTKSGYGFVGWSTDTEAWDHLTDNDDTNNPTIYGPNQMITVDPSASTKLELYAVWAPAETDASGNPISLQDWQGCSSFTPTTYSAETGTLTVGKNTITALTDSRDGNIYTVARLADGNCWMTENLRLDNEPELSQQNTNNPSLPLTNNYAEQTTSNFLSATSNDWCTDYNSAPCYNQSKLNTNNTALTATSPAFAQDFTNNPHDWNTGSLDINSSSYSNYYNWYSATAGNGKQETGGGVTVAGDICPAGWILPIGSETSANGSFSHLDTNMGGTGSYQGTTEASNRWRSFPNNFVYSGNWHGSSAGKRGSFGYYWSSTASNNSYAYSLYFYSGDVDPGTYGGGKGNGFSVRCVAPVQ